MPTIEFVIADANGRGCFNFYETMEAATADLPRANGKEWESFREKGGGYEAMTWEEYSRRNRAFWLADPPSEVTEERWTYFLEVLPPKEWTNRGGFESFLMIEHTSGSFTQQCARLGQRYWTKTVDASDRATWMTRETLGELAR
jgi:hypothetical protein